MSCLLNLEQFFCITMDLITGNTLFRRLKWWVVVAQKLGMAAPFHNCLASGILGLGINAMCQCPSPLSVLWAALCLPWWLVWW